MAKAKKTQTKSLPAHLTPGNPGNSGGKKGRSGRLASPFKAFLGKLRSDPEFHGALQRAALDENARGFAAAIKLVTDYDEEKPAEKRELSGKVEVSVAFTRETRKRTAG